LMKGKVALRPGLGQLLPHKRVAACERSTVGLIGQWVRSTGGRAGDLHTTSGSKCTGNTQVATLQSGVFITGAVRCGAVPDRARPRVRPCSPSILQVVLVLARWIGGDWWCVVWCLLCCEGPPGPGGLVEIGGVWCGVCYVVRDPPAPVDWWRLVVCGVVSAML
jgi:hypothetical protein